MGAFTVAFTGLPTIAGPSALAVTLDGGTLTATAADSWSISLTGLGALGSLQKLWFVIKAKASDADADALLFVTDADGLTRLGGAAAEDASLAEITIDDEEAGDITIDIDEAATALVGRLSQGYFAVKRLRGDDAATLIKGKVRIRAATITAAS